MKEFSLKTVIYKVTIVHTITYFFMGLAAFTGLNYTAKYADPAIANLMRPTDDPLVALGPALQIFRGVLFGLVSYNVSARSHSTVALTGIPVVLLAKQSTKEMDELGFWNNFCTDYFHVRYGLLSI
ncbi:MAG: hypothetical protein ABUK01_10915 [Leptospirales bacterium]